MTVVRGLVDRRAEDLEQHSVQRETPSGRLDEAVQRRGQDLGDAGRRLIVALPAWLAVTVQLPGFSSVRTAPDTEQIADEAAATVR